jgi:hypothetical protein
MEEWYKLYSTKDYLEANIIKGMLEENQVKVALLNKQDSSYLSFGEIELYVPAHFKEIAIRLLNNALSN